MTLETNIDKLWLSLLFTLLAGYFTLEALPLLLTFILLADDYSITTLRGLPTSVRPDDCQEPVFAVFYRPEPTTIPPLDAVVPAVPPVFSFITYLLPDPIIGCRFGRNGCFLGMFSARYNMDKICSEESIDWSLGSR